jgi:hypothetical protein
VLADVAVRTPQPCLALGLRALVRHHRLDAVVRDVGDRAHVVAVLEPVHAHLLAHLRQQLGAALDGDRTAVERVWVRSALGERRVEQPVAGPLARLPGHRGRDQRRARPGRRPPRQVAHARLLAPGLAATSRFSSAAPSDICAKRWSGSASGSVRSASSSTRNSVASTSNRHGWAL